MIILAYMFKFDAQSLIYGNPAIKDQKEKHVMECKDI